MKEFWSDDNYDNVTEAMFYDQINTLVKMGVDGVAKELKFDAPDFGPEVNDLLNLGLSINDVTQLGALYTLVLWKLDNNQELLNKHFSMFLEMADDENYSSSRDTVNKIATKISKLGLITLY